MRICSCASPRTFGAPTRWSGRELPGRPASSSSWRADAENKEAGRNRGKSQKWATALTPVDRPVLLRWADAMDRAQRHLEMGDEDPIAHGSMGQEVESPHYG